MLDPAKIIEKAKASSFYMKILNWGLSRMIPFNKPHGFRITEIGDYHVRIRIPYKRRNLNHIRGLHACAMATISEFATGLMLMTKLKASEYRLIMRRLEMEYHFQGKMDAVAEFVISEDWLKEKIFDPLKNQDAVEILCEVNITDTQGNHLSTGHIYWHVKDWKKVRTQA